MTVLERKARFFQAVLNDSEETRFFKLEQGAPCVYTVEELKQSLDEIEQEFAAGQGIPHSQIRRKEL